MENYDVELFEDGISALKSIQLRAPDAIVLDLQLPDIDGLEICRRIRRSGDSTPILMLTARDAVNDRVAGLDVGADDYLVKPFDLAELLARLRALLRRHNFAEGDGAVLRFEDLSTQPADPRGPPRRAPDRTDQDRIRPARAVPAPPPPGPHARPDPRPRVGLQLRLRDQLPGRLHRLSAPQARGGQRAAADPDGARRRVRASHHVTFRSRVIAATVGVAAIAVVLACFASFFATRNALDPLGRRVALRGVPVQREHPRRWPGAHTGSFFELVLSNGQTVPTTNVPIDATILSAAHEQEWQDPAHRGPSPASRIASSSSPDRGLAGRVPSEGVCPSRRRRPSSSSSTSTARSTSCDSLVRTLLFVALGGLLLALGLGLFIARTALAPSRR